LGALRDVGALTAFADYRVPVVLRTLGVLRYSRALAAAVEEGRELAPGSEEEVEIRAATLVAVERLRVMAAAEAAAAAAGGEGGGGDSGGGSAAPPSLLAIQVDWFLWEEGERSREEDRHHKTLTIYY
jgi:hypothetical protein